MGEGGSPGGQIGPFGQIGLFRDLPDLGLFGPRQIGRFQDLAKSQFRAASPVYVEGMAKPSPTQLLALSGLHSQLALGGKPVEPASPFWGPLRRRKWLSEDGRLSPEGVAVLDRYRSVALTCRHCQSTISSYVADRRHTKTLRRRCRICGSERQLFEVDGASYEVVGSRRSEAPEA